MRRSSREKKQTEFFQVKAPISQGSDNSGATVEEDAEDYLTEGGEVEEEKLTTKKPRSSIKKKQTHTTEEDDELEVPKINKNKENINKQNTNKPTKQISKKNKAIIKSTSALFSK